MAAPTDVLSRIDEIESELRGLSAELLELRALVTKAADAPVAGPAPTAPVAPPPVPATSPVDPAARLDAAIGAARIHLSEGERSAALDELDRAIEFSRTDPQALRRLESILEGIARYQSSVRARAGALAETAGFAARVVEEGSAPSPSAATTQIAPPDTPRAPRLPIPPTAAPVPAKPARTRRTAAQLAADWDLLGPRGFAIIGGAVTAFGVILLFVLAANRGWITPAMRVAFGAGVSAAAVGVAFWVRSRYGQLQVSLGAAGAGIAGGYATLAAAAARYDLVPDWLALPLAGGLAAVAVVIAIAWSSETVAAIGLLGAALAPALQAIDTGLSWPSVAFAVIILAATVTLAVPRRWHTLLIGIGVVVGAQVAVLALDADASAGAGTTAAVASFVLVVLAAGVWLQLASDMTDLDPLASSFVLAAVGLALLLVRPLWDVDRNQGLALAGAAVVWAGAWIAVRRVQPALALVLGVSSLSLAAVATADLLSGTSLAITWAAEALLLSFIGLRARDARLQATALVYCGITAAHVLLVDAPPKLVFEAPVPGIAAASVAALALALLGTGFLAPVEATARTESGLLAWLAPVRTWLAEHRVGLQEGLVLGAAASGTYAAAILLTAYSFRPGHLAATIVATTVGALAVAISARRGSVELVAASLAWVGGVFAIATGFDVPEFAVDAVHRSYGGWALIAASAGVLAACFAFQLLFRAVSNAGVPAGGGVLALAGSAAGIALISPAGDVLQSTWIGWRLLAPSLVLLGLAASVFRIPRHRDLATILWALGAVALLGSEWLVVRDATWRAVAFSVTAAVLGILSRPLRERRLWFAGWIVGWGTALVTTVILAAIWIIDDAEPMRYAIAGLAATAALVVVGALAWGDAMRRDLVTVAWATAILSLILGEAFLVGGGPAAAFVVALTGAFVALLATPLREERLWWAGAAVVSVTSLAVLCVVTPPSHFVTASATPAEGLWVALGCVIAGVALRFAAPAYRRWIESIVGIAALYVLSLGILDLAERTFGGSIETDFERGHVAVSVLWTLIGLGLLVAGLIRDSRLLRYGGLALFGLSLAKIFLYDLSALNSVARALSFIVVGALVLVGGFFLQRLSAQRRPPVG
jgi:uncharacterized membrane protein